MSLVWSFSSLKTFQQCPKKYYHLKEAKDVVDTPHEAAMYGSLVHKAAEDHVRDGKPIPKKYSYMEPIVDALKDIPGGKHCELELGITESLQPCAFRAPDVWWHGIIDLLIVDEEKKTAHMVDYKTGKSARYADTKQLDYMAVAVFAHFPAITKIKSALLFVVSNEFVRKQHEIENKDQYIKSALVDIDRLKQAKQNGVWNPIQGPLCKFCPVKQCEHNRS
jgi:RecB family exonuclease